MIPHFKRNTLRSLIVTHGDAISKVLYVIRRSNRNILRSDLLYHKALSVLISVLSRVISEEPVKIRHFQSLMKFLEQKGLSYLSRIDRYS